MIYLFERELLKKQYLFLSLSKIHGLSSKTTKIICKKLGFSYNFKVQNLSKKHTKALVKLFDKTNITFGDSLIKYQTLRFKQELNIKLIKGLRKLKGLPIRGQRTHTNAKNSRSRKIKIK